MIEVKNLTRKFGDFTAVDNLTFNVEDGEIFGFLGPNGAGKTTTIRMIIGLISKTEGEVKIFGQKIGDNFSSLEIRKNIGFVPDNVGLYEELSAYDNLDFYGKLYECSEQERKKNIKRLLDMVGLWDKRDQPVGSYSKGMKQKVAICRALVHDPKLIFMDEPTTNLDPEASKTVRDFILQLKKERKTIFLNTHNLDEAQRICDRIGILKTKLLAINTPEQLQKSIWGSKTVIQLDKVTSQIITEIKKLKPKNILVEGNKITLDVEDPAKENPAIVRAIVKAKGDIQFITPLNPDLEETYLKIVEETK